jgi:hypothetical protein
MASTTFDALYETIFGTSGGKSQREKRNELVSFYEDQFVERAKLAKRDEAKRDLSHDPTWIKLTTDMAEMNTEYSRHEQALMRLDKDLAAKSKELSEYGCDESPQPRKLEYDTDTIAKIKRVNDLYKADRDA